jgi:sorbitol/mannitol transport system permease protein
MRASFLQKLIIALLGWAAALLMFFPVAWMALTSFKTEIDAVHSPPLLVFHPTLANYATVIQLGDYVGAVTNSVTISVGATILGLLIAMPAAYAMAFFPNRWTKDLLLWMLSTKMMPAVGVLMPVYLLCQHSGLLDTRTGLILVMMLANLPIIVWMLYTFFKEIPGDIIEASRMDGAGPLAQLRIVLLPLAGPGIASTALLAIILSWNEAFWSLNLTSSNAAPLTAFIATFSAPQGLFWAKLSAASTLAVAPILVFGWMTQRQLVRGLTFGAVK